MKIEREETHEYPAMEFVREEIQTYPAILITFTAKRQTTHISIPMLDHDNVKPDVEDAAKKTVKAIYHFIEENINGKLDSCGEPIELIESEVFAPLNHIYERCQVWLQHGANKDISFAKYLMDKHFAYHNFDIVLSKIWCLLDK